MSVVGMKLLQFTSEGINIGGGESPSPIGWERVAGRPGEGQSPHDVQYVECPDALRGFDFADGFEPGVTGPNLGWVGGQTGILTQRRKDAEKS